MSATVNHFLLPALAAALLLAPSWAAGSGREAGGPQEGADRFVPSFAFLSGIRAHPWEANAAGRLCRECRFSDPGAMPVAAQPPAMGDDLDITPFVSGSLELMTPELPLPGSPRIFFGGELGGSFGTERKVAREGDPSSVGSPFEPGTQVNYFEDNATGQGTEVVATNTGLTYSAHAGVAFPFQWLGRQFRLRPSVGWTRFEVDLEGRVVDAECFRSGCNQDRDPAFFLRNASFSETTTEAFDGIGPGLELEMETGRLGPFGTSLLVGASVYKILGDTRILFTAGPTTFDDRATSGNDPDGAGPGGAVDEYDASFRFDVDPWFYRMTVGLRFYWIGESR